MSLFLSVCCFSILAVSLFSQPLAEGKDRFLGNIISPPIPTNFDTYWNQVTPENAGKWGSAEPAQGDFRWDALDAIYYYAMDKGFPFKQHNFVWGQQQPSWLSSLSQDQQRDEVEMWISEFGNRYPLTDMIDVVNEPLHTPPAYKNALGGNGATGWDWVIWAFEKAREYCPGGKLILNEFGVVSDNNTTTQFLTIINLLKNRGLIDGIGEQGHFFETTYLPTIRANLDRLAAIGLPIYISEFDLNIADDNAQLKRYQDLFPILWEHPGVAGITLWGYIQGKIWRTDGYLVRTDGTERPALVWLRDYIKNYNAVQGGATRVVDFQLRQNYPNPFNPSTEIAFDIKKATQLDLSVFDLLGHQILTLRHGFFQPGSYKAVFDASRLPSGVYIYRLKTSDLCLKRKCVYVR
jgi:endo-1,4-beta-xylanase